MGFFDAAGAAQAAGRRVRMAPFIFMDVEDDPVRLWGGSGEIDIDAGRWQGFGELVGIPTLQQLVGGQASRLTLSLSGVSAEAVQLVLRDREQVVGRALKIGAAYFGDDEQPLTGIYWFWRGAMDKTPISRNSDGGEGVTRVVTVEAASRFSIRKRAPLGNYTDRDQQTLHPGDRFCERAYLNRFSNKIWPTF